MSEKEGGDVSEAIRLMCQTSLGVLDKGFLCQSLSMLQPNAPLCVEEAATLEEVLDVLRSKKTGCAIVVDKSGKVAGIFSERDFILKVAKDFESLRKRPVSDYMTRNPETQPPDGTIAYALNLMSQGGFRHIPIVDADCRPIGMVSVKDVVDYMVETFTADLMNFPVD